MVATIGVKKLEVIESFKYVASAIKKPSFIFI